MILFRDTIGGAGRRRPCWFPEAGFAERETAAGRVFACCDPLLLDVPPGATWHPVWQGTGWEVALVGKPDVDHYRRDQAYPQIVPVVDAAGQIWFAPRILTARGTRGIPVPFGPGWKPMPRADQQAWLDAAQAAREELLRGAAAGEEFGLPVEAAMTWASQLLAATYHLPDAVFPILGLLDEVLARGVLLVAAGLHELPADPAAAAPAP